MSKILIKTEVTSTHDANIKCQISAFGTFYSGVRMIIHADQSLEIKFLDSSTQNL